MILHKLEVDVPQTQTTQDNPTLNTSTLNELLEKLMVEYIRARKPEWPTIAHINALDAYPMTGVTEQEHKNTIFTVWFENGQEFVVTVDEVRS